MRSWRNRQTRSVEGAVATRPWGFEPSGRTQAGQAAQHQAAVVHQGERQLAKLEAAGSSPADRTSPT
jgi:hypothetical protein